MQRQRHSLVFYALEVVPHPGEHEIRVRRPPDGMRIRNERGDARGQSAE